MEKTLWQNLKAIFMQYQWRFAKAILMVLAANVFLILNPLVFRQAILALSTPLSTTTPFSNFLWWLLGSQIQALWAWAFLLVFISLIAAFLKYRMRVAFISISRDAEREVRSKIFNRIQEQSMAFYDRHGIGELLSRLTNDISAYRDVLGPGIMYPLFFLTLVIPGLIALFTISPELAAISLFPLLVIPLLNLAARHKIYYYSLQAQQGLADLSNMAQEHFSGIRIIKGYAGEKSFSRCFAKLCQSLVNANIKLNCFQGLLFPFFTLLTKTTTVLLVVVSGFIILKAWASLNAADFVSFMWIQSYIFFPILMLAWVLPIYERGRASYQRLVEIYSEPNEIKDDGLPLLTLPRNAAIEFNHLTFRYPGSQHPVLNDFSTSIKSGSFVGITGPVGAGKTTLFRIINREYEIPRGKVSVGGRDIHDYPLDALWKQIVTVEQIPFLFSRSIADNVRFGKNEALLDEIETVAKYADLHETILDFPEKYDTIIGERGVTLSGGQKQRLAMARAFLVNRSILLLDDVFSSVDAETEMRMFIAMQMNFKDKTVLLITHRVSILESMDRILYMDNGRIIEDGTPQELKSRNGHYAALVQLQRAKR